MKTFLAVILASVMLFSLCAFSVFAETADESLPTSDENDYVPNNNSHIKWVYYVVAFCALGGAVGAAVLISKKH